MKKTWREVAEKNLKEVLDDKGRITTTSGDEAQYTLAAALLCIDDTLSYWMRRMVEEIEEATK